MKRAMELAKGYRRGPVKMRKHSPFLDTAKNHLSPQTTSGFSIILFPIQKGIVMKFDSKQCAKIAKGVLKMNSLV